MKPLKSTLLVLLSVGLTSCATILNEDLQQVNVSSTRPINGTVDGVPFSGPGVIAVKRAKAPKMILVETEGCTRQVALQNSVDPIFFVNIFSGGLFGSTTDYVSEKMWKYQDQVIIPCN